MVHLYQKDFDYVLCNKAPSLLRSTHNEGLCWYSDLISHTNKHTYTHTHIKKTHSTLRDQ